MTEKKVNTKLPAIFQNIKQYEKDDARFLKVKIWLMHTGINFNGSSFSKEVVENAIPTLANTPILAFIEENSVGEQDFSDHRLVLHRNEEGEINLKYLGSAVGVIPEANNARWEMRVTDSGEEKEYLVVDALMWTKWDEPTNIMKQKGITSQSMELSDKYSGTFDKDGVFQFETFEFFGACLLGEDVLPAMQNSTVEIEFSKQEALQNTIEKKMQEFYTLFSQEGGTEMEDNNELDVNTNLEEEVQDEVVSTNTEFELEPVNEEVTPDTELESNEPVVNEPIQEFALSGEQMKQQIRAALSKEDHIDHWGDKCRSYWYVDYTDTLVIFENIKDGYQLYQAPYAMTGDNVEIKFEESVKVKIEYVPFEGAATSFASNFERIEAEKLANELQLDELRAYKRQREELDIKAKFADKLSEEEFTNVFEAMKDAEIQDVEDKLFAIYGKKNFSVVSNIPNAEVNKVALPLSKEENVVPTPYGGLFEKYNK
ncbi:hypothetical protein NSQ62_07835 [Solibacillus sp. FSL H8-0523]|uniref:hypothetical protein n=1 Tax=Solibacillus sp. FSL H8-0523 TaxID=2954511 RepID=UPI0031013BC2